MGDGWWLEAMLAKVEGPSEEINRRVRGSREVFGGSGPLGTFAEVGACAEYRYNCTVGGSPGTARFEPHPLRATALKSGKANWDLK